MTVSLGGITLADDLYLSGLESAQLAAVSVATTIGGKAVVASDVNDIEVGIELRLSGDNQFTLADITAVRQLRGQVVELIHHRGTFDVLVISTPDEPAWPEANPETDDWYSGEILMITV